MDEIKAKVKRRSAWRGPLILLGLFIVVLLIISFSYRVRTIEVVNASEYTDEEIIEASGINMGDNLFFVDRFNSASLIFSDLKYMDTISIQRSLPGKIVIQAEGSAPSVHLVLGGEYWLMARNGKILGTVSALEAEKYPELRGFPSASAMQGEELVTDEADASKLAYACEMITAMQAEDMLRDVLWMDFSDGDNPGFRYQRRLNVYIGKQDGTDFKLASFRKAIELLSKEDTGTLTYAEGSLWKYAPD